MWVLPPIGACACIMRLRFGGQVRSGRWGTTSCSSTCTTVRAGVCVPVGEAAFLAVLLYNFSWSVQAGDATGTGFMDCILSTTPFS